MQASSISFLARTVLSAVVTEQALGTVPWLVVEGDGDAAFEALGARAATQIRQVAESLPEVERLRERLQTNKAVRDLYDTVVAKSARRFPEIWSELEHLAAGANVPLDTLLLLNLRGDLGTGDDFGCSDAAVVAPGLAVFGHNEDGHAALAGRCFLLTLRLDAQPAVTSWWYPGFLPGTTFTVNAHGLAWGVDNINVIRPLPGPGRGFVARAMQRAHTIEEWLAILGDTPSAGGFAYTIGSTEGRVVTAETAHGETRVVELDAARAPTGWHTNHLRLFPQGIDSSSTDSLLRGEVLERLALHGADGTGVVVASILTTLTSLDAADGVARDGQGGKSKTLCSFVVSLTNDYLVLVAGDGPEVIEISLSDFALGKSREAAPVTHSASTTSTA